MCLVVMCLGEVAGKALLQILGLAYIDYFVMLVQHLVDTG